LAYSRGTVRGRYAIFFAVTLAGAASGESITFQNAADGGYQGTRDVRIYEGTGTFWQPTANYGTNSSLVVSGGTYRNAVLMQWDLSILAPGTDVYSSTLFLRLTTNSTSGYEIYECNQAWVESQATWNQFRTGSNWATAGATGAADRGTVVLGSILGNSGTTVQISLSAAGIALVERWINSQATNRGLIVQEYTNSSGISWYSSERSAFSASERPRLRVVFDGGVGGADTLDFQNGVSPSTTYVGNTDTVIANGPDPKTRNNNASGLQYSQVTATLMSFDVSGVPVGSVVQSVALDLTVLDDDGTFPIYEALQPWTETGATWNTYDGTNAWALPGAEGPADRGATLLGTFVAGTLGGRRVSTALNDAGVALVQRWVDGVTPNRGFLIGSPTLPVYVTTRDSEYATATDRPALVVVYSSDGGTSQEDGGSSQEDGGSPQDDGGTSQDDGGTSQDDAGVLPMPPDAGDARTLQVGCSCGQPGADGLGALVLLLFAVRRRLRGFTQG
jgi:hypothetical protein